MFIERIDRPNSLLHEFTLLIPEVPEEAIYDVTDGGQLGLRMNSFQLRGVRVKRKVNGKDNPYTGRLSSGDGKARI